jgi:hypothetical protein
MKKVREFRLRVLDIGPWVDYERGFSGISCAPWVHCNAREAKGILKEDVSRVEEMESVEVHLLGDSPSERVVIKASEG